MYLFSRTRVIRTSQFQQAMAYAPEIAAKVTAVGGTEISAWASVLSPSAGTIVWTAWFDSLSEWETMTGKLAADSSYYDAVMQGDAFFHDGVEDGLLKVVRAPAEMAAATYVSSVRAIAAPGQLVNAMQRGVAIAEAAEQAGGLGTMFASAVTGPYGGCAWFTGATSIAEMEAAEDKTNADTSFLTLVADSGACYQNAAETTMYRRMG